MKEESVKERRYKEIEGGGRNREIEKHKKREIWGGGGGESGKLESCSD